MTEGSGRRHRQLLAENIRSGAVNGACEFTREMFGNLERAVDIQYHAETGVTID